VDDRPASASEADPGFSIEEIIGPDGRYVLYYRWPDDAATDDPLPFSSSSSTRPATDDV
jgi:hypothetical protein